MLRKRIANEIKVFDNLTNDHFNIQFSSNENIALYYNNM